jgi:hypothetical protein
MDEKLKYKLYFTFLAILAFISFYSIFGYFKEKHTLQNSPIIVNRSSLKNYKLIKLYKDSNGYKMDLLEMDNQKEFKNIFLSEECPAAASKEPGLLMKLDVVTYFLPSEQETYQSYDRAYDYLCTHEDMVAKDAALMKRIQESRVKVFEQNLNLKH